MGYDLHITRRAEWWGEGDNISFEEWRAYCESDPRMQLDGFAVARAPGGDVIEISDPGLASWKGPEESGDDILCWYHWHRGIIDIKAGDEPEVVAKSWEIAQHFCARIQGDEGECYGADGEMLRE